MSLQNFLNNLKTVKKFCNLQIPYSISERKFADSIISTIQFSSSCSEIQPLPPPITSTLLSSLTPNSLLLILSEPLLYPSKTLNFFNYLLSNPSLIPFKLEHEAHLTLLCRLVQARESRFAKNVLDSLSTNEDLFDLFNLISSFVQNRCVEPEITAAEIFNMMIKVYSRDFRFKDVLDTFDYMKMNGFEIYERACTVHLISLNECGNIEDCLEFFYKMVESGVEVSVFSLSIVVDGLCKSGEIKRGIELVKEMASKGIEPNVITCNTLVDACSKRWYFEELENVVLLMEEHGVRLSVKTYGLIIDAYTSSGKIEEAKMVVDKMRDKGLRVDSHFYTLMISGFVRLGKIKSAVMLFDEMHERGVYPNVDAYRILVCGLCENGEMGVAADVVVEMQKKEFELDKVVLGALIEGNLKQGLVDEAVGLLEVMEEKGDFADISVCKMVAFELCKLNQFDRAEKILGSIFKRGSVIDMSSFAPFLDKLGFCGSKQAFCRSDSEKE